MNSSKANQGSHKKHDHRRFIFQYSIPYRPKVSSISVAMFGSHLRKSRQLQI